MTDKTNFCKNDFTILSEENLLQGFLPVNRYTIEHTLFNGDKSQPYQRDCLMRGESVGVLPYDPSRDEVVLIKQFRIGALHDNDAPWMLELVAGVAEENETPEDIAKRELLEEANLTTSQLTPIFKAYLSPGGSNEFMHFFLAKIDSSNATGIHGLDHENEDILVQTFSTTDAFELINKGTITSAPTILALQWLALRTREQ